LQLRFREIPSCAVDGRQLASGGCVSRIRGPGPGTAPVVEVVFGGVGNSRVGGGAIEKEGGCCGKRREEWEEEGNGDNVAHNLVGEKEEVGLLSFSLVVEWYLENH